MLQKWTGEVVGTMHIYGITAKELAGHMGIDRRYLSGLLNGKRNVKCAERNIREALSEMIQEKENAAAQTY